MTLTAPLEVEPYSTTSSSWVAADGTAQGSSLPTANDGNKTTGTADSSKIGKAPDDILRLDFDEDKADLASGDTISYWPTMLHNVGPIYDSIATAGSATTLTDSTQAWSTDENAGRTVRINGGTGAGQERNITSNTATVLTVPTWGTTPDTTSEFVIFTGVREMALLPYNAATGVSATNKLTKLPIGTAEVQWVLTSAFISDLFDQGSGAWAIRIAVNDNGAGDVQWAEVEADITVGAAGDIVILRRRREGA